MEWPYPHRVVKEYDITTGELKSVRVAYPVDLKYLASISPYIQNTLFGPMKNPRYKLNDVKAKEFRLFHQIAYDRKVLKKSNIEEALDISDFFMCDKTLKTCEKWLLEESKMDNREKLVLAVRYNLENLKNHILGSIETISDVEEILPEDLSKWSKEVTLQIYKKILHFFGLPRATGQQRVCDVQQEQKMLDKQLKSLLQRDQDYWKFLGPNVKKLWLRKPRKQMTTIFDLKEPKNWTDDKLRNALMTVLGVFGIPRSAERSGEIEQEKLHSQIRAIKERQRHNMHLLIEHKKAKNERNRLSARKRTIKIEIQTIDMMMRTDDIALDLQRRASLERQLKELRQKIKAIVFVLKD